MNSEFIHNYMISSIIFFILFVIYKIVPKNDRNLKHKKMKRKEVKRKEIRCPRCENKYLNIYKHCLVCGEINPNLILKKKHESSIYKYILIFVMLFIIIIASYIYAINS